MIEPEVQIQENVELITSTVPNLSSIASIAPAPTNDYAQISAVEMDKEGTLNNVLADAMLIIGQHDVGQWRIRIEALVVFLVVAFFQNNRILAFGNIQIPVGFVQPHRVGFRSVDTAGRWAGIDVDRDKQIGPVAISNSSPFDQFNKVIR